MPGEIRLKCDYGGTQVVGRHASVREHFWGFLGCFCLRDIIYLWAPAEVADRIRQRILIW
jgi:hypothetical protein